MEVPNIVQIFTTVYLLQYKVLPVESVYSCYNTYKSLSMEICYSDQKCCGYYGEKYCCDYIFDGGKIAGITIGCLVGIAAFIALIVVCCNIMNKNRGQSGRVVYPGGTGVTVVSSNQQSGMAGIQQPTYPMYGGHGVNPGYPPPGPPPYPSTANAQYPPTAAHPFPEKQ